MRAGGNNLWRGHSINHQLSFQSVLDPGVGLGAGGVMGHLALAQGQPQVQVELTVTMVWLRILGLSVLCHSQIQSWICQSLASNSHNYVFFLGGSRKGLRHQRQLGKGECHLEILTQPTDASPQGSSTPACQGHPLEHRFIHWQVISDF